MRFTKAMGLAKRMFINAVAKGATPFASGEEVEAPCLQSSSLRIWVSGYKETGWSELWGEVKLSVVCACVVKAYEFSQDECSENGSLGEF